MTRRDWRLSATGLTVVVVAAIVAAVLSLEAGISFLVIDLLVGLIAVAGLYYTVKTFDGWGGRIGRRILLVALGINYYGLMLHFVHLPYHTVGNPALLGLVPAFWTGFVHVSSIAAFIVAAYGFYLFTVIGRGTGIGGDVVLTRGDRVLMAGWLVVSLIAGVLGQLIQWTYALDILLIWIMIVPALVGLFFVYRGVQRVGGLIARNLTILGVGLFVHILLFVPLVQWHLELMPAWIGIPSGAWYVLLHGMSGVGFLTTTYAFYRFAEGMEQ